jgi:putative SOS response-associated peptidase YedK
MCGRYDLNATALQIAARFQAQLSEVSGSDESNVIAEWRPRYNMAPQQDNPVIVRDNGGHNQLELMRWGLVPAWSKEARLTYSTINARAETVASKPTFRKSLATQRCLVPATGYFEWVAAAKDQGKQPYRIRLQGDSEGIEGIFAFAGLYDIWQGPDGEALRTYTIVTTTANDALSHIHSRMPVILPTNAEAAWLDKDNRDVEELVSLLQPYPAEGMTAYPVSKLVNSPSNEGRELIEPLSRLAT